MKKARKEINIELAPMIDVVFLLLLFFLVSSVFRKDELAILLNLPHAGGEKQVQDSDSRNLLVELGPEELALNSQSLPFERLEIRLKELCPQMDKVEFRADRDVRFERVAQVIQSLHAHECGSLKIVTQPREQE